MEALSSLRSGSTIADSLQVLAKTKHIMRQCISMSSFTTKEWVCGRTLPSQIDSCARILNFAHAAHAHVQDQERLAPNHALALEQQEHGARSTTQWWL